MRHGLLRRPNVATVAPALPVADARREDLEPALAASRQVQRCLAGDVAPEAAAARKQPEPGKPRPSGALQPLAGEVERRVVAEVWGPEVDDEQMPLVATRARAQQPRRFWQTASIRVVLPSSVAAKFASIPSTASRPRTTSACPFSDA